MEGNEHSQSVSSAEYLNINFYLACNFDLEKNTKIIRCSYTVDGDAIKYKIADSSDEALDWIHDMILDELETNIKALQNKGQT